MATSTQITNEMLETQVKRAAQREALVALFNEIFAEILDDCGDWDAVVEAFDIYDSALNGDHCEEHEFEDVCTEHGIALSTPADVDWVLSVARSISSNVI